VRGQRFRVARAGNSHAAGRVVWICVLWALVHSVLASKQAKALTRRIAGPRYRDDLYRFIFNVQSVVLLVWAARRFSRLPDQELYRVKPPWSWLFRASQAASLGVLLPGVRVMSTLKFAGITPLLDSLTGKDIRPKPETQGPPVGGVRDVTVAFREALGPGVARISMTVEAKGGVSGLYSRLSGAITAHSLIVATLSVVHSLRTRGLRGTLLLAASGNAIPILGELVAVNVLKLLRHHVRPQVGGSPAGSP
jgi:hypothetical protein